ncbi:hypothetical protein [Winogradskyella sp.]|uniref:O-antigen ligase family protein n=1 Tax=Winogradskyella sp. TaxID=1883156 RepID=UPI0025D0B0C7|nr:hypothetical protein [Winogradskyella sp.]
MKYNKAHKSLIIFMLFSILVLLVYDLFNEVDKRGEVTEARDFPRIYRILILIISGWFYLLIDKIKKAKFNRQLIVIYGLISLHIIYSTSFGIDSLISLSKILYLLFVYLFFFKFYSVFMNRQTIKYLNLFVIASVLVLSVHIIASRFGLIGNVSTVKTYGNNNAYILLSFLPLIHFNRKLKIKRFLVIILVLGVFLSLKRGAIVALLGCLLGAYFFERRILQRKGIVEKLKRVFVLVSFVVLLFFLYSKFADLFIERLEDFSGDDASIGSGRGNIYNLIWKDWFESNDFITYFLGKGYNSVQVLTKIRTGNALMAHSDGLNFLHSYGLVGISLLLVFVLNQIKTIRKLFIVKSELVIPYFMLFVIFFFKSIYSGNFETPNFIYLLIGYAIINVSLNNLKIKPQ